MACPVAMRSPQREAQAFPAFELGQAYHQSQQGDDRFGAVVRVGLFDQEANRASGDTGKRQGPYIKGEVALCSDGLVSFGGYPAQSPGDGQREDKHRGELAAYIQEGLGEG